MDLREAILAAEDGKLVKETVTEWGVDIYIKSLTTIEREKFTGLNNDLKSDARRQALVITSTMCDADGRLIFTAEDIVNLVEKNSSVMDRLTRLALKVNGLASKSDEDAEEN